MTTKYLWLVLIFSQHAPCHCTYAVRITLAESKAQGLGALISDRHVVTVADFLSKGEDLILEFGAQSFSERWKDSIVRMTVKFSDVHIHQEYQPGFVVDNIGFIQLPTPVNFTDSIYSIQWPSSNDWPLTYDDYEVHIVAVDPNSPVKNIRGVPTKIVKFHHCQPANDYILTEGNFCYALQNPLTCGQNPGSLIVYKADKVLRVLGFASSHEPCPKKFQISTRFVEYVEWFQYNLFNKWH